MKRFIAAALAALVLLAPRPALAVEIRQGPASATAPGYVTTGTQEFAGNKTYLGTVSITTLLLTNDIADSALSANVPLLDAANTWNKTAQASTTETLAVFRVSDDSIGKIEVMNGSGTDGKYIPWIRCTGPGSDQALIFRGVGTTDNAGQPIVNYDYRIGASTAVATRDLATWTNNGTAAMKLGVGGKLYLSNTAAFIQMGTGSPESAVTAPVGSMWLRTDGGASTVFYVKESGSGNTGWVAK